MSKINVIKYDPSTEEFSNEVVKDYKDYYKLLDCKTFDVVSPMEDLSIYVDDEGLFKEGNEVTQINLPDGRSTKLAGILVFAGAVDNNGEQLGVNATVDDIKKIVSSTDLVVGYE